MTHFQDRWNIMLATDSYKASHHNMYPDKLGFVESYMESRGGEYNVSLMFGTNYMIKSYLLGKQVTPFKIEEARVFYDQHFGLDNVFNVEGWKYIMEKYDGFLPIKIEAVKEGSIVPVKNVLLKISNTDEKCAWLVNWCETLLMKLWYPITVATNSLSGKEILDFHMEKSGMSGNTDFLLHDFGYRGVATEEQAWVGGAAHLLSFRGTDTVAGIRMLQDFYGAKMCGYSVNASEHSVMCSYGKENEIETYKTLLRRYPKNHLSLVSDTWDIFNVCHFLSEDAELKNLIINRDGVLVIRPDSGDPKTVLEKCLEILSEGFGFTVNDKGFKTIHPKIKLIQGDGIDIYSMNEILNYLAYKGWSIDNLVFGSGGGLLQKYNRDTMKFAIKASYVEIDGKGMDIYKDPVTSTGSKTSKRGRQNLCWDDTNGYTTMSDTYIKEEIEPLLRKPEGFRTDMLQTVFENGILIKDVTYDEIIETIKTEREKYGRISAKQPETA